VRTWKARSEKDRRAEYHTKKHSSLNREDQSRNENSMYLEQEEITNYEIEKERGSRKGGDRSQGVHVERELVP